MPRLTSGNPTYRLHRASGQAIVTLNGRDIYLGPFGTKTSKRAYDRVLGQWLAAGRQLLGYSNLSVSEMLAAYKHHCRSYYRRPDGTLSEEVRNIEIAIKPLRELYGRANASEFGPRALKTVRQRYIASDLCRNEVNNRTRRIVRAFKWAVANELIPPSIYYGLKTVDGLRRGRSGVRETLPVKPVPDAHIEAIRPFVLPPVWAMVQVQHLTGMRPGEVPSMRVCDLDMSGKIWQFTPETHKTAWHGQERKVFIGPLAQKVLKPWLKADPQAYLFSAADAMAAWNEERRRNRKTPMTPSQAARRPRCRPKKSPGTRYDRTSYARAIASACRKADQHAHELNLKIPADKVIVPHWHPHQLRHNAATAIRKQFGLDAARAVLGQRSAVVAEIYAELDFGKAATVMGQIG